MGLEWCEITLWSHALPSLEKVPEGGKPFPDKLGGKRPKVKVVRSKLEHCWTQRLGGNTINKKKS
jgi:hypothetical protein